MNDPGPEPHSDARLLNAHEARMKLEALEKKIRAEREADEARKAGQAQAEAFTKRLWTIGRSVVGVVTAVGCAYAWGQSRIDAGVAPVDAKVESLRRDYKEDMSKVQKSLDTLTADAKASDARDDKRWEAVLWRLNVRDPAPAPPTPKDAGR